MQSLLDKVFLDAYNVDLFEFPLYFYFWETYVYFIAYYDKEKVEQLIEKVYETSTVEVLFEE